MRIDDNQAFTAKIRSGQSKNRPKITELKITSSETNVFILK
jgi:hypothetical protein